MYLVWLDCTEWMLDEINGPSDRLQKNGITNQVIVLATDKPAFLLCRHQSTLECLAALVTLMWDVLTADNNNNNSGSGTSNNNSAFLLSISVSPMHWLLSASRPHLRMLVAGLGSVHTVNEGLTRC